MAYCFNFWEIRKEPGEAQCVEKCQIAINIQFRTRLSWNAKQIISFSWKHGRVVKTECGAQVIIFAITRAFFALAAMRTDKKTEQWSNKFRGWTLTEANVTAEVGHYYCTCKRCKMLRRNKSEHVRVMKKQYSQIIYIVYDVIKAPAYCRTQSKY